MLMLDIAEQITSVIKHMKRDLYYNISGYGYIYKGSYDINARYVIFQWILDFINTFEYVISSFKSANISKKWT